MTTGAPPNLTSTAYASHEARATTTLPNRFEEPSVRQLRLQRSGERDPWAGPQLTALHRHAQTYPVSASTSSLATQSIRPPGLNISGRSVSPYMPSSASGWPQQQWASRQPRSSHDGPSSPWPASPMQGGYSPELMSSGDSAYRTSYPNWQGSWPAPMLRRTSSEEAKLSAYGGGYYRTEDPSSGNLQATSHPQRRPANRDEFDGPSQLLEKPTGETAYEPKEEDMPQLPITLYAQEQDDILSKVNDRLSQCAFDFVAKYQFPVPIEPDKRPVRVPNDREWSEWVYLLKRLATKRRIPARVLYNGQIKQLITILENSLEMRHAAKHQSRPLKDDRNILQLISSGLQVAKIIKDATAMQYLDSLYVQTERLIQSRRPSLSPGATAEYATSA
ncbi:hypothetical protein LTR62_008786 [Meristemomyces frigidus]|uniref:Uncharacterized protein n=1 Tax=Meristemomyces frigidus TaxID=1508187 RepID=A0AAN7TAI8_9PEZI|nr:hypothetical protein LTR62_008786 [Meristemomyces frigidus]